MSRIESLDTLLARSGCVAPQVAIEIILRVARQVAELHLRSARIHGALAPKNVTRNTSGGMELNAGPAVVSLGDRVADPEVCPPELQAATDWGIPAAISAAQERFRTSGLNVDPRRIDVYQLGVLLCRLVTGQSVQAYLASPQAVAKVPPPLRALIDRALGYDERQRLANADEFLQAAEELLAVQNASPSDLPFASLGHFQILARLGRGGMGDVYQGYESALDRKVAIKVLPAELARQEDFVRRFRAEAAAVARLTHPNVVQIHFIGEDQGHHFFAMQYVAGESLAELLARRGRLSPDDTLAILQQALAGLAAAHKQGIIHRDIKPANLLIDRANRRALLADFGLVKSAAAATKMTATGIVMGTVDYISPEQGRGQSVDARSDLYSVGVLMYQMLSGSLPFEADSPTAMIFQHVYEPPRPLQEVAPHVPAPLCAVVHRLLAKAPEQRYQTADELLADIRALRTGRPLAAQSGRPARGEAGRPQTSVVQAPAFHDVSPPSVDGDLAPHPPRWQALIDRLRLRLQQLRQRLFGLAAARLPEFAPRPQDTQQQVDGAVAEYERRHDSLQRLVGEAQTVLEELRRQAAEQGRAAEDARRRAASADGEAEMRSALDEQAACRRASDELAGQVREQEQQLETMQVRLAEVNATLHKLRSQRDVLNARLKLAQAKLQQAAGSPRQAGTGVSMFRLATLVAAAVLAVGAVWYFWPSEPHVTPRVAPRYPLTASERPREIAEVAVPSIAPLPPHGGVPVEVPWPMEPNPVGSVGATAATAPVDIRKPPVAPAPPPDAWPGSAPPVPEANVDDNRADAVVQTFKDLGWNVVSLAFSPDGNCVAAGKLDGDVLLFDVKTGRRLAAQTDLRDLGEITALSFSSDGQQLFLGGYSGLIRIWHLGTGGVLESGGLSGDLGVHQKPVRCICPATDGSFLITGSDDKRLVWQQPGPAIQARTLTTFERPVKVARLTADGTAVIASDGREVVWADLRTFGVSRRLTLDRSSAQSVAISPDGTHIACCDGYDIKISETDGGQAYTIRPGGAETQWAVLYTPDSRRLLSGGRGNVYVWDTVANKQTASLSLGGVMYIQTLAVSSDGSLVAAVPSAAGQTLYVFRLAP